MRKLLSTMMSVALLGPASLAFAADSADAAQIQYAKPDQAGEQHARQAVADLKKADPGLMRLFDEAAGYAVFATVGKGAVGVGGAHGTGLLYEKGAMVGKVTLTQLTVGLALGAQAYTEVVFFETEKALADFKKGEVTLAAQVSAVVVKAGASASAKYIDGMSVFTHVKGGVMAEASVGGQKFGFQPYLKAITVNDR